MSLNQPHDRAALALTISQSGRSIWERSNQGGMTDSAFIEDGTLHQIIAVLSDALVQARAELGVL